MKLMRSLLLVALLFVLVTASVCDGLSTTTIKDHRDVFALMKVAQRGASADVCDAAGCVLKGQACNGTFFHFGEGARCTENCCAIGLTCHSGVCKDNNFGDACATSDDCFSFLPGTYLCLSNKCQPMMYAGDTCQASDQCYSKNCQKGVCQGVEAGGACSSTDECAADLFCNGNGNGTCTAYRQTGDSCDQSSECAYQNHCVEGVCRHEYDQHVGDACTPSYHFWEQQCQAGLACQVDTCRQPTVAWGKSCVDNSTCGGYSCGCNPLVGQNQCETDFMPKLSCSTDGAYNCMVANKCRGDIFHYFPGTCSYQHCGSAFLEAAKCACPTLAPVIGNCVYLPLSGYQTCSAVVAADDDDDDGLSGGQIAGIAIGTIFGILIIFGLIFWISQRRGPQGYEDI